MTVYFSNPGLIDLDVIRVMGVSVKTRDNPIGYFGTGLKFALATLLRTGHEVRLFRGDEKFSFSTRPTKIRGQSFQVCYMNDSALPFTTELGRNWEPWQAYRELHSNTIDEGGQISDKPVAGDTVIEVEGAALEMEYRDRDSIFVSGAPLCSVSGLEVYDRPGKHVFYRGVRAGAMPDTGRFTYNITKPMTLTEDRTLKSQFDVEWTLSTLIPKMTHKGMIHEILCGGTEYDKKLNFSYCSSPSAEFLDVAAQLYSNQVASNAAKVMIERDMQERGEFKMARMDDAAHAALLAGFEVALKMGASLSPEDVDVVESLGPSVMAIYHKVKHRVFIARSTLDCGVETIGATLYEEWLHMAHGYEDCSRPLQNFLFQRLAAIAAGITPPNPESQSGGTEIPF